MLYERLTCVKAAWLVSQTGQAMTSRWCKSSTHDRQNMYCIHGMLMCVCSLRCFAQYTGKIQTFSRWLSRSHGEIGDIISRAHTTLLCNDQVIKYGLGLLRTVIDIQDFQLFHQAFASWQRGGLGCGWDWCCIEYAVSCFRSCLCSCYSNSAWASYVEDPWLAFGPADWRLVVAIDVQA